MELEPVIGLEVHAQLNTNSKIFCSCSTRFGAPPNSNTCPVCLGMPGALPVLNDGAVELALKAGIAVNCKIPPFSIFARKNYFYPDLPKGYQISQYEQPLATDGELQIPENGASKTIRIKRIHMEEDAGKLLHEGADAGGDASLVDFNRAGVPLIEIVSEPDLNSPAEAYSYLTQLKAILQYCEISQANMEEGQLRCDANISLRPKGSKELGTKVEIKNLNSFRNVVKALEYEVERQEKALQTGQKIVQETRLYDADKDVTESMRSKEEAHDYRYFPDPDLTPLHVSEERMKRAGSTMPELPAQKRARFSEQYALTPADVEILTETKSLADFFEQTAQFSREPKLTANWILRDVLSKLKEHAKIIDESNISTEHLAGLIKAIANGTISGAQGKEVFEEMWDSGESAAEIIGRKGISQISGEVEIGRIVDSVLAENPEIAERYRKGELKLHGVLVGLVMKASGGKANPSLVSRLIQKTSS